MNKILEKIKEFDTIVIHGHIRPDGDCIGSQYGLMYLIKETFPNKNVFITGDSSEYVSFVGKPQRIEDDNLFKNALSIVVDCPTISRISDDRCKLAKYSIKIDHHADSDKFTDYEYVDYTASSCTQIITEFFIKFNNELKMSEKSATALYVGLLTDTGRFQNLNVNSKTYYIASVLLNYGVDISYVNNSLTLESVDALRLKAYCLNKLKVTENGFAYITLTKEEIKKYGVGDEVASSLVTSISTLKECPVWGLILETEDILRIRLRSRGPEINGLAALYNGGGHKLAAGGKLKSWNELDEFVRNADELVKNYKDKLEKKLLKK